MSGEVVIVDDGVAPSANKTKRRRTCTGSTESASVTSQRELAALATHGAPLMRPTILQDEYTFNAPPQLSDPDVARIPVPADGLCLYHCCVAARDVASWRANTRSYGCGVTQDVHREMCMHAALVRQCHLEGARERPARRDDLALVADVVGGAIALSVGEAFLVVGDEGISMHIGYVSRHSSGHLGLYQSYLRTPRVFRAGPVVEEASGLDLRDFVQPSGDCHARTATPPLVSPSLQRAYMTPVGALHATAASRSLDGATPGEIRTFDWLQDAFNAGGEAAASVVFPAETHRLQDHILSIHGSGAIAARRCGCRVSGEHPQHGLHDPSACEAFVDLQGSKTPQGPQWRMLLF